jgi:hypothetical protein
MNYFLIIIFASLLNVDSLNYSTECYRLDFDQYVCVVALHYTVECVCIGH